MGWGIAVSEFFFHRRSRFILLTFMSYTTVLYSRTKTSQNVYCIFFLPLQISFGKCFNFSWVNTFPSVMNMFGFYVAHPQEAAAAAAAASSALALSTLALPSPLVSHQPAALHRLRCAGVHLSGQEARLRGAAHHHRCLLGALWDLGGEKVGGSYCTRTHTRRRGV